jgi:hypothetical protein
MKNVTQIPSTSGNALLMSLILLFTTFGCNTENESDDLSLFNPIVQDYGEGNGVTLITGDVYADQFPNRQYDILFSEKDNDKVDKLIFIGIDSEEIANRAPKLEWEKAGILTINGVIFLHPFNSQHIFSFHVDGEGGKSYQEVASYVENRLGMKIKEEFVSYTIVQKSGGDWTKEVLKDYNFNDNFFNYFHSYKVSAEIANQRTLAQCGNCTSGGEGATACMVKDIFGVKCSVQAGSGYYACCNDTSNYCIACPGGEDDDPSPCGLNC